MDLNSLKLENFDTLFDENIKNISQDVTDSDYNSDVPVQIAISENNSTLNADEILQNGIFVETNKGLVCMSLKDVLSSNVNLSVDDFKKVATQLLSQEDVTKSSNETETTPVVETDLNSSEIDRKKSSKLINISKTEVINKDSNDIKTEQSVLLTNFQSNEILLNNYYDTHQSTSATTSEAVDTSEETDKERNTVTQPQKRRGGWPKGRKRKPELLNLPPKAPKTSYNIFLNERRKLYKDKLAFHEITRVVGNQWSSLTPEEKRPYIERAEEDKKRYREELQIYRRSDAYKLYLARKRKKRAIDNLMSESDMDGTDDIDDEENDMLYCDICDQWFYNMHNKREHLQSWQHKMTVAGDVNKNLASSDNELKGNISSVSFSTSLDESSMDATPIETESSVYSKNTNSDTESVYDNMVRLIGSVTKREKEIKVLNTRLQESKTKQHTFVSELNMLKHKSNILKSNLTELKKQEISLEQQLIHLWNVPSLFVINNTEFVN